MKILRLKLIPRLVVGACLSLFLLLWFVYRKVEDEFDSASDGRPVFVEIKRDILQRSRHYVQKLAAEQKDVEDGPYSGHDTAYDLKKTLAVLLESLLQRVDRLEKLAELNRSRLGEQAKDALSAADLISGSQEKCPLPAGWQTRYPQCEQKMKWMSAFWKTDPCYQKYGVDGSNCSIIVYLSEVEHYCPKLPTRPLRNISQTPVLQAVPNFSLPALFGLMTDNPTNFKWIKTRLERMWPKWVQAYKFLSEKKNFALKDRKRKKILLHLGLLTKESGFKFGEKSLKGGPLGELVQWSDLLAALHLSGHDLVISSEIRTFANFAQADPALKSSCPVLSDPHVDIVFTDIVGLRQMKKKIPGSLQNYKCRLRVLDSFGTQAEFNYQQYFTKHKGNLGGKPKNVWGGHGLNLQQFYTMYPHSPDNTFLGFVVETYSNPNQTQPDEVATGSSGRRENWTLVYGKEAYMWKDSRPFLDLLHRLLEVHATVSEGDQAGAVPRYVLNHGVLAGEDFHRLLRRVKLFVGLGFPYEGPAPLEAVANGAIYLNPRFSPAKGRRTDKFFAEKPTLRELRSQNPYTEEFLGPPYVLTIDISNETAVRSAVATALNTVISPYLPYEFTVPGMLERVSVLTEHQDFCGEDPNWPPFSAIHLLLAQPAQSCKDACWQSGFVCERSFFRKVNNVESLARHETCKRPAEKVEEVYAPAVDSSGACLLQASDLLFSCASPAPPALRRLCPCRDFVKDQVALCAACL